MAEPGKLIISIPSSSVGSRESSCSVMFLTRAASRILNGRYELASAALHSSISPSLLSDEYNITLVTKIDKFSGKIRPDSEKIE